MNVLLINDSSSNPNWGDRAAALALKRMIRERGGTITAIITEDELRESCFFRPCEEGREQQATGRSLQDWLRLLLPPVVFKLRDKFHYYTGTGRYARGTGGPIPLTVDTFEEQAEQFMQNRADYGALHAAIAAADVLIIHGDGCMVGNGILPRSELFLAYLARMRFGKPVLLINHTADFSHPELDRMAALVYPQLDDVTYRDQISAELCRDRWAGRYAPDTAFLFEPAERAAWSALAQRPTYFDIWPDTAAFDPARPYICIGGTSGFSFDGQPTAIIDDVTALVRHLQSSYPGQIVLTASDRIDEVIFRPVARRLGLPLIGLTIPVQQAIDIVGNAQAYVGGRWHVAIFALRGGTPVIPLSSKTFKIQALMSMAGLQDTAIDAYDLSGASERIGRELVRLIGQGDELRARLRAWARQQAENCWDNLAYLDKLTATDGVQLAQDRRRSGVEG
ncbi:MAG: polysaccharide pyruvyl transferase family protein [Pseudomonadota bacterium]